MDFKKLRESAGITQEEAARLLGVGRSTIYRAECGITKRFEHDFVERAKATYAKLARKASRGKTAS